MAYSHHKMKRKPNPTTYDTLTVARQSSNPFTNRQQAGIQLGRYLEKYKDKNVLISGIPRGGVILAIEIARILNGTADLVLSQKLAAPGNPELAIGAMTENGHCLLDRSLATATQTSDDYLEQEKNRRKTEMTRQSKIYRKIWPSISAKDRIVIVTDDGLATGATMLAALIAIRHENPQKLICAVPVGPQDALQKLREVADEVLCLNVPHFFDAVSRFYREFDQVSEKELKELLRFANR